jgi:NAD(P)-dependent dehydrogenase (short-subunit alcohol dehydrogenase family)
MKNNKPLEGLVALVTGASRGLGYATALMLARAGAHVIAVARTQGGLEELDDHIRSEKGTATLVPLDITDGSGIDRMASSVFDRWKKLDILIGNAAILGTLSPLGHLEPSVWDKLMAVNVTANWRLIRAFDPLLKQSEAGKAFFITSNVVKKNRAYWGGYTATKAALESLVKTYAAECQITNVQANLLDPGVMHTALRTEAMPGENTSSLKSPQTIADMILPLCYSNFERNGDTILLQEQYYKNDETLHTARHENIYGGRA